MLAEVGGIDLQVFYEMVPECGATIPKNNRRLTVWQKALMGAAICHSDHIEANGLECVEDIDEPIWKHEDALG